MQGTHRIPPISLVVWRLHLMASGNPAGILPPEGPSCHKLPMFLRPSRCNAAWCEGLMLKFVDVKTGWFKNFLVTRRSVRSWSSAMEAKTLRQYATKTKEPCSKTQAIGIGWGHKLRGRGGQHRTDITSNTFPFTRRQGRRIFHPQKNMKIDRGHTKSNQSLFEVWAYNITWYIYSL